MADNMTDEELSMYKMLYPLIGAKVKFVCDGITYQGTIASIIIGLRMVCLRHASMVGGDYLGTQRFRFWEMKSLAVVESKDVVNRYPKNDYILNILKNRMDQKHVSSKVLYNDDLSDDEKSVSDEEEEDEFVLDTPSHLEMQLPRESIVLDCINEYFQQAISNISEEKVIGVSFEGLQVSRFGGLSIICIATASCIYIFDIEKLKNDAFDYGLRKIFEDKFLKKVIHDCRFPSDCLAHRYSTELTNVFDTQVADFVISMQRYKDKYEYKYVSSLDGCLRNHLQIPPEFLFKRARGISAAEKSSLYTTRPIKNNFKYDLVKNALYLILLHKTLAKKMQSPLQQNVKAYLNVLAGESDEVVQFLGPELSSPDCIPPSLLMNGIQTVQFRKPTPKNHIPLQCKLKNPITGEIIEPVSNGMYSEQLIKTDIKCNGDNSNVIVRKSEDQKYTSFNKSSDKMNSADSEKNMDAFDSIIVKPCNRHIDEVYYRAVRSLTSHSNNSQNVINVKPSEYYVSTFSIRKPSSDSSAPKNVDSNSNDCSHIWEKIRKETISAAESLPDKRKQKIRFVPAGMSY